MFCCFRWPALVGSTNPLNRKFSAAVRGSDSIWPLYGYNRVSMGCLNGSTVPGFRLSGQVALVSYIREPLGSYLDGLCRELVPGCKPRAHISLLPPRPLPCEAECAGDELQKLLESTPAFDLVLGEVEVFPVSQVIYVSIAQGQDHLRHLHRTLNRGLAKYQELFPYHPHVTLAQDLGTGEVPEKLECARQRWRESPHERKVRIDQLSFVQHQEGRWVDLQDILLSGSYPPPQPLKTSPEHLAQPTV